MKVALPLFILCEAEASGKGDVRFWPKADVANRFTDIRFEGVEPT
jgi:hypothetical protein